MNLKEFFYLQKSDRQVLLVLAGVIIIALTLLYIIGKQKETTASLTYLQGDSLLRAAYPTSQTYSDDGDDNLRGASPAVHLFPFDPNTADSTQLLQLGLRPWQVRNIYRYRAKGGVYRQPSDFARLYGLTVKQYRMLEPYIRISSDYLPASSLFPARKERMLPPTATRYDSRQPLTTTQNHDSLIFSPKLRPGETVILNMADTNELKRVPGIGSYYARTIIRYGQRLGGYHSIEQLREISGFPEEALSYFKVANPEVRRMNVNTSTLEQLRKHPYCNFYQARAIIDYRRLHGSLHSLDDLKLLKEFPPAAIQRLKPYVVF
jgi:DNA uptake protein ComE-like DNA-binding protein